MCAKENVKTSLTATHHVGIGDTKAASVFLHSISIVAAIID